MTSPEITALRNFMTSRGAHPDYANFKETQDVWAEIRKKSEANHRLGMDIAKRLGRHYDQVILDALMT